MSRKKKNLDDFDPTNVEHYKIYDYRNPDENYENSLDDGLQQKCCFYINGEKPKMLITENYNDFTPDIWTIDANGYLDFKSEYATQEVCAPIAGTLSENIDDDVNLYILNADELQSRAFYSSEIAANLITRQDSAGNNVYLFANNISPEFISNGQIGSNTAETLTFELSECGYEKDDVTAALDCLYENDCKMISAASKIVVTPAGVLIDTLNRKTVKISVGRGIYNFACGVSDGSLKTMDGDTEVKITSVDSDDNTNIENGYRYVKNIGIQKYVNQSGFEWSNVTTTVKIYTNLSTFYEVYEVGDVVEVTTENLSDDIYKVGFFKGESQYLKIADIGENDGVYYIEFENTFAVGDFTSASFRLSIERKFPDATLGCESQNRVWLAQNDGHEIYASALGDPKNYYDYSGLNTDSYAVNVGTSGKFTGVVNYLGTPLFFKENALHIISGGMPSEYYVTTYEDFFGCEEGSENSFAVINNILYYKSPFGIVAYDGSTTTIISDSLGKDEYKKGVGGALGNKYYISLYNVNKQKRELFCYDTSKYLWTKETDPYVTKLIPIKNKLYCIAKNEIFEFTEIEPTGSNVEESIEWFAQTGIYGYSYPNKKYISRFQIRMYLEKESKVNFYIQYNSDGIWRSCGSQLVENGISSFLFPIRPQRCDHMSLKIEGTGKAKIYSITKLLEEGGDI